MINIKRYLQVPEDSFFLFGPRGVGKSTWLRQVKDWDLHIDLLQHSQYIEFLKNPSLLRDLVLPLKKNSWVWIDEVQKVPDLLDEVHSLMETHRIRFALSGSSARKLKRHGANLLAGRAITRRMETLTSFELGKNFDLTEALEFGGLPLVVVKPALRKDILKTYVATYLREEIQEEGHVRKIEPFVRFLEVAALLNGQVVNLSNVAKEAAVPRPSVDGYFSILEDTLLGYWLPSFRPKVKVRENTHSKFYWFDPGVARSAAGLMDETLEKEWLGRSLETLIFHELRSYNLKTNIDRALFYYNTPSRLEIDFIVQLQKANLSRKSKVVLIEVKLSESWDSRWETAMRDLNESGKVEVMGMYGIYMGKRALERNGVKILPALEFLKKLYAGEIY
ncbi:MAG: ATP-binding protein [Pseudobdellovibrionaceae bacterium]